MAGGLFGGLREKLEKLPPLPELIGGLRRLRWPAYFLAGLLLADLLVSGVKTYVLANQKPKPHTPRVVVEPPYVHSSGTYEAVNSRNIFCPGCPFPAFVFKQIDRPKDCNRAQLLDSGPKLIGTIVLGDKKNSVATVSEGSDSVAVQVDDTIQGLKVFEIRRNRVCFVTSEGLLRYIELPEDGGLKFGQPVAGALPMEPSEGVSQVSDSEVEIKQSLLLEKLADPDVLKQAYATPYRDEPGGPVKGFQIRNITPGSIFEKLVKPGDVIVEANGAPMNSIAAAQEFYGNARTTEQLTLGILRNGQKIDMTYKVKK